MFGCCFHFNPTHYKSGKFNHTLNKILKSNIIKIGKIFITFLVPHNFFICYNTIIPGLGIAFKGTGSAKFKVLTVPVEYNYKREDWNYKVEFKPANPDIAKVTGREAYYLSDIVSHIRRGYARLVDIRDFQEEAKRLDNIALNTEARIGVL